MFENLCNRSPLTLFCVDSLLYIKYATFTPSEFTDYSNFFVLLKQKKKLFLRHSLTHIWLVEFSWTRCKHVMKRKKSTYRWETTKWFQSVRVWISSAFGKLGIINYLCNYTHTCIFFALLAIVFYTKNSNNTMMSSFNSFLIFIALKLCAKFEQRGIKVGVLNGLRYVCTMYIRAHKLSPKKCNICFQFSVNWWYPLLASFSKYAF